MLPGLNNRVICHFSPFKYDDTIICLVFSSLSSIYSIHFLKYIVCWTIKRREERSGNNDVKFLCASNVWIHSRRSFKRIFNLCFISRFSCEVKCCEKLLKLKKLLELIRSLLMIKFDQYFTLLSSRGEKKKAFNGFWSVCLFSISPENRLTLEEDEVRRFCKSFLYDRFVSLIC